MHVKRIPALLILGLLWGCGQGSCGGPPVADSGSCPPGTANCPCYGRLASMAPACGPGQACDAGVAEVKCQGSCQLSCTLPEARGIWPSLVEGDCICETSTGYFYSVTARAALPCDADGDGWVRVSAKAAMEDPRPGIASNARCQSSLRTIDRFELENEAGEVLSVPLTLPEGLPLYETDKNDSQAEHNASQPPFYPAPGVGRGLHASEVNSLTKACISVGADVNDNTLPDLAEWGRPPGDQAPVDTPELKSEFEVYTRFSYFMELHRGWYRAPVGQEVHGAYRIREKPRSLAAAGRVPFVYGREPAGAPTSDFWQSCPRGRDRWYSPQLPATGLDFASLSAPAAGWTGMNSHGQFKCVVVSEASYTAVQSADAGALNRHVQRQASLQELNWQVNTCAVLPSTDSNPPVAGVNPSEPQITCAWEAPGALDERVVWALAPIQEPAHFERGCIKLCGGQRFLCPGVPPDAGVRPPCYTMCADFGASEVRTLGSGVGYRLRGEVSHLSLSGPLGRLDGGYSIRQPNTSGK